jgi:hypothetical protein
MRPSRGGKISKRVDINNLGYWYCITLAEKIWLLRYARFIFEKKNWSKI